MSTIVDTRKPFGPSLGPAAKHELVVSKQITAVDRGIRLLLATAIVNLPVLFIESILQSWVYFVPLAPFIVTLLFYLVVTGISGSNSVFSVSNDHKGS